MKTDETNVRLLMEAFLLDSFHRELQDPRELEADIRRLKLEIARLEGKGGLKTADKRKGD